MYNISFVPAVKVTAGTKIQYYFESHHFHNYIK